jgi:UDP-GlcNAc:undecaprenyl-phosphate GlcNAc-1-phosphate transferase
MPILISAIIVFIMGVVDDFRELPARLKLPGQCIASLIPVVFGFQFSQFGPLPLGLLGKVITFLWFIGLTNALNLIDGIDALCGSISFIMLLSLGVLLHVQSIPEASVLSFILAGCVAAFLLYNKPKAAIFMGDGGSQFLGFMIAALPLLGKTPRLEYNLLPFMIVIAAIPILDTFAAIWRRTREGRSFFSPDKLHLHHKFLSMGYTKKSILFFLDIIQFGICAISLLTMLWIEGLRGFFVLAGAFIAMIIFFAIIHYTSRSVLRLNEQKGHESN